jgi:DNA-binding XRE family transcriptional regulator
LSFKEENGMNKDVELSTFGNELMALYRRANLSQGEFATLAGISPVALRKWESDQSCPKVESLKSAIEVLVYKEAFKQGAEQTEARYLWQLAMQRGLKVPFDEVWFVGIVPGANPVPRVSVEVVPSISVGGDGAACGLPPSDPYPLPYAALVSCANRNPASPNGLTLALAKTRGRHKGLLVMLIALIVLLIIGSAGTLFFYARGHATDQAYPGYLSGHGTLAFFDPLSQQRGSQWDASGPDSGGLSCQFTGGAYHVSAPLNPYLDVCPSLVIASNFAFEVQLTISQGYCGGMIFRADDQGHYYAFRLCEDGIYWVVKYGDGTEPLYSGRSSAFHTGLGQQNKIAVVANGSTMFFYINEQQINQEHDSGYASGKIGLIATTGNATTVDVAYRNARLWTL